MSSDSQGEAINELVAKMQAGRMSRRTFLWNAMAVGLSSSAAISLLEACGGSSNSSGGNGAGTNINAAFDHDSTPTTGTIVENFNKTNKDGVHVTYVNGPNDTGQLHDKFATMLRARGKDTDVMTLDIIWPAEFGGNGWTVPLDDKFPASERSKYLPGPLKGCTFNGKLYAAPLRTDAGLMYHRTDLVPTAPSTWEDLTKMAEELGQGKKAANGYVWQGAQYEGLVCDFSEVLYGYGGNVLSDDGKTVTVNSPEALAALTNMVAWVGKASPTSVTTYKEEDARTAFQNGSAVFMRNWPYAYSLGQDPKSSKVAGKIGVTSMLHGGSNQTGHSNLGGWNLAINAFSKNPDASWKFIQYMLGPEAQKQLAIDASFTVTLVSIYDDPEVLQKNPFFKDLKPVFQNALPRPVSQAYPDITAAIQQRVHSALLKQATPKQALADLADDLKKFIKS